MDTNIDKVSLAGRTLGRHRAKRRDVATGLFPLMRSPCAGETVTPTCHAVDMNDLADDYADNIPSTDPLSPIRGVALGVVICVPVWIALFYAILR